MQTRTQMLKNRITGSPHIRMVPTYTHVSAAGRVYGNGSRLKVVHT